MNFADRLDAAVARVGSPAMLGIDPHLDLLPDEFAVARDVDAPRAERAAAIARFSEELVDVAAERVAIVKPQSAFYEQLGADGVAAWERTVRAARSAGLLVLGDMKRGDMGTSAAGYARAYLDGPGARDARVDAITVQPYQGEDSVRPFLDAAARNDGGAFVLLRTSNPSSNEVQQHGVPPVSDVVASAIDRWGAGLVGECGYSSLGAVVGATRPEELAHLRALCPRTPFLIPGVGAQGGRASDLADAFPDPSHPFRGAVVNSSRAIAFAYRADEHAGKHWKDAANDALDALVAELRDALASSARA